MKNNPILRIPIYQVDAFASQLFAGNPAAVCPLQHWLPDGVLQQIALENNLSETAFFVPEGNGFRLRWFTPKSEVKLCGHATLAAAFVLFEKWPTSSNTIRFESLSGPLLVRKEGETLALDFPAQMPEPCSAPAFLREAFGLGEAECWKREDYILVLGNQHEVESARPNMEALLRNDLRGALITSKGDSVDFVSRFFAPNYGIPEDPVTGSAHTQLAPFWAKRLGKTRLHAQQVSERGGELFCELKGERVLIAGRAVLYLEGEILIPQSGRGSG